MSKETNIFVILGFFLLIAVLMYLGFAALVSGIINLMT